MSTFTNSVLTAALLSVAGSMASAAVINDATGDLINGFTAGDLDVVTAEATYDNVNNTFTFTSTLAGAVGTTSGASYVWGVNRGAGTAGFAANGYTNVLFDRVVRLLPDGTGAIAGGGLPVINLPAGSVTISGNTITGVVAASLLPNNGFTFENYTVNLWPRVATPGGFAGISDFAPDTNNAAVTVVPAPAALGVLAAAGLLAPRRRGR